MAISYLGPVVDAYYKPYSKNVKASVIRDGKRYAVKRAWVIRQFKEAGDLNDDGTISTGEFAFIIEGDNYLVDSPTSMLNINWGDGTFDRLYKSHTYPSYQRWMVVTWGKNMWVVFSRPDIEHRSKLIEIITPFPYLPTTSFKACLEGNISLVAVPNSLFYKFTNVTDFSRCFMLCSSLASIPEGLFSGQGHVISFQVCFALCSSLTSIPEGLFDDCISVEDFGYCFNDCRSLTSIPEGLFDNCVNVKSFNGCFSGCASLISVPEGLFDNCENIEDISFCFQGCKR